jgi:ABC-type arginine/histidine transport system permease subunit
MTDEEDYVLDRWKQYWILTIFGSSLGTGAIIVNLIYLIITNEFPSFWEGEIFETIIFGIPLIVFLWFLRTGVEEYSDIKRAEERNIKRKKATQN